jgi:AraC-like DNA-binding protein
LADFKLFHPLHPELKGFINKIALFHYRFESDGKNKVYPNPPVPYHSLNFYPIDKVTCRNYFKDDTFVLPSSILIGPQVTRVDLTMGNDLLVIPVVFAPGGLHRLLGVPMLEMLGFPFDASLFLGKEIEDVNYQLFESKNYHQMLMVVENYLLKKVRKLKPILPFDLALANLEAQGPSLKVDQISQQACISIRQLKRQFKERVGLSPKTYTKLMRLTMAWKFFENNPKSTWSHIAHQFKYADQMHLIRDFKEFTGVTPTVLQRKLADTDLRIQSETFE